MEPLTNNSIVNKECEQNLEKLGLIDLSKEELKDFSLTMFVDTYSNNGMLNNFLPSKEQTYSYLDAKIPFFDYFFYPEAAGGTTFGAQEYGYEDNTILLNPYYMDEKQITNQIIFHELLHALTTTHDYCGIMRKEQEGIRESGRGLNEGITEYITQQHVSMEEETFEEGNISFNTLVFFIKWSKQ